MNSLNILSARVTSQPSPIKSPGTRPRSYSDGTLSKADSDTKIQRRSSHHVKRSPRGEATDEKPLPEQLEDSDSPSDTQELDINEKTPLLGDGRAPGKRFQERAKRLVHRLACSLRWVLSTITLPGFYIVNAFYDDRGRFSLMLPLRRIRKGFSKPGGYKSTAQTVGLSGAAGSHNTVVKKEENAPLNGHKARKRSPLPRSQSNSESDSNDKVSFPKNSVEYRAPASSSSSSDESTRARRSIRIKLSNEENARKRKQKREKADDHTTVPKKTPSLTVATIKSPITPASSSRAARSSYSPTPPRPLIPPRQPSYSSQTQRLSRYVQKTLVIDLDETLIHSLAKGGRMSSGHMVEVKLNATVGYGGGTLGPQHPILYYVHKRPHCDDFLRKVCKWYNLVVFTASVQEYADPVIDWLEQERKYFSSRYYRQHCTFRNGAYIKDLSSVEPDLSKVMILDNSPLSYIFHEGRFNDTSIRDVSDTL